MEELTIEEKAARYDKAINIARKINSGEGVAAPSDWTTCEVIFPELKESEGEKIRKRIIQALHGDVLDMEETTKAITWLEKLDEQKPDEVRTTGYWNVRYIEQNPTEWSGEDEDYINDLIKYFSQNERLKNTKEDIVIWLKSLKSQKQWKPSEEQMKALAEAISLAKNCGEESSFDLQTLYEQLKAL